MYIGYTADVFKPGFPCRTFSRVGTLWYELHSERDAEEIKAAGFSIWKSE